MLKMESFMVVHIPPYEGSILLTKNCTPKRALRLWKRYMKKNTPRTKGTYVVTYARRHFEVRRFEDTV